MTGDYLADTYLTFLYSEAREDQRKRGRVYSREYPIACCGDEAISKV